MSSEPLSFFTVDRGTASTSVALIAPDGGRFRLLAAGTGPAGADIEALLEDLVGRVVSTDPDLLPMPETWADWARLVSVTGPAPRVVCAATTDRALALLERTFAAAGWEIAGRIVASRPDALAAAEALLDPAVSVVAITAGEPPTPDERAVMPRFGTMLAALIGRRDDLGVLLCGPVLGWADGLPAERTVRLPQPFDGPPAGDSELRTALRELATTSFPGEGPAGALHNLPDSRTGLRVAVATLAGLLDRRVEAVEVGHAAGSRALATPEALVAHLVTPDGALVPERILRDDRELDAVVRWSTLRADPFSLHDRIRNLEVSPWRDSANDGPRLRLAALRAALARMDDAWRDAAGPDALAGADLLVCSGGAFNAVPPAAAALAVVDTMRRPGALALFHDHARVLAPLGTLPDEGDRRRLLVDLLDDILLPLGSAVVAGDIKAGSRTTSSLRITSSLQTHELELSPGVLRLVDLPPGVPAHVELETIEGSLLGTKSRRMEADVTGGLGGLLVDTREIPLKLPDRSERRRALLESWERPVWAAVDA
ncbi:MAG: hypothetical protein U0869_16125 [Chloroflexota bacterium]